MVLFLRGIVSDKSLLPDGIQRISSHFSLTKTIPSQGIYVELYLCSVSLVVLDGVLPAFH
jgi:hypothetical protein